MGVDFVTLALAKKYTDEHSGGSGPSVQQVQSDFNQNDTTAVDYIKNRTHYQEDDFTVTYDGVIGDKSHIYFVDYPYGFDENGEETDYSPTYLVKIGEAEDYSFEQMLELKGTDIVVYQFDQEVTGDQLFGDEGITFTKITNIAGETVGYIIGDYIFYCTVDNITIKIEGVATFDISKGLWVVSGQSMTRPSVKFYVKSISFKGKIKQLDLKYIPELESTILNVDNDGYVTSFSIQYRDGTIKIGAIRDYSHWSQSDKNQVIADVKASLSTWTGGSY